MTFILPDIDTADLFPRGIKPRIFVSYSRANIGHVSSIVQYLERAYYEVWFDKRDIAGGEDWKREIAKGIQSAERVLFFMSPESCESEYCRGEISHALKHGIHIIPVRINTRMADNALDDLGLSGRQYIDWAETDPDRNWERLLNDRSMLKPPLDRDIRRLDPRYEQMHRRYLKTFFRPVFRQISLSDITDDSAVRGVPLESVYVPLPVDMRITIQVDETDKKTITDWWVQTERSETRADENIPDELRDRKLREWPALKVDEAGLSLLLADVERQLIERAPDADIIFRSEQTWAMEAHDGANVQKRMVLTGIPGSGKSMFLKHLALCLAGDQLKDEDKSGANLSALSYWTLPAYTPVFIRLAELVRQEFPNQDDVANTEDFDHYLSKQLESWTIQDYWSDLQAQLYNGSAIILLDGLDEVPNAVEAWRRNQIIDFIDSLTNEYGKCRFIITSRPYAYDGTWKLNSFGQTTLVPLFDHRILQLAEALFKQIADITDPAAEAQKFYQALQRHQRDKFWNNPLQFTMGAAMWIRSAGKPIEERIPPTPAILYDRSVKLMLEKWTRRDPTVGKSVAELLEVTPDQLRQALERLALQMQSEYGSDQRATFKQWILIEHIEDCVRETNKADRRSLDFNRALDLLEQRAGLLVSEEARLYRFQHLSYQEYLAACELAKPAYFPDAVAPRIQKQPGRWRNVIPLLQDIIKPRGTSELSRLARALFPAEDTTSLWRDHPLWEQIAHLARMQAGTPDLLLPSEKARLRTHLVHLVEQGALSAVERAEMGRILSDLRDPRLGVGLREDGLPDIAWSKVIPAGEFIIGSDEGRENEKPRRTVRIEQPYQIAKYPVTYQQFQAFIDATDGWNDPRWWEGLAAGAEHKAQPDEQTFKFWNHPRTDVSWYDALAFCRWLSFRLGGGYALDQVGEWALRLPTEQEWERAARGTDERLYPYGDTFDAARGNTAETGIGQTSAVGIFPDGISPVGVLDMSGNVWEWCLTGDLNPAADVTSEGLTHNDLWVVRGGSWFSGQVLAGASIRDLCHPDNRSNRGGFRVLRPLQTL